MNNKNLFNLIEKQKETKSIFKAAEKKVSQPIKSQMLKFLHMNLDEQKRLFSGFSKFEPKDLQ